MGWPQDAIFEACVSGHVANPDIVDECQMRIVDLHRKQFAWLQAAIPAIDTSAPGNPALWEWTGNGWVALASGVGVDLTFPLDIIRAARQQAGAGPALNGAIIHDVKVKVYNGGGAVSLIGGLAHKSANIATATTAPSGWTSIATDSSAGLGAWDTLVLTPAAPLTIDDETIAKITLSLPQAGDIVVGCRVEFEPLTPTP